MRKPSLFAVLAVVMLFTMRMIWYQPTSLPEAIGAAVYICILVYIADLLRLRLFKFLSRPPNPPD